MAESSHHPTSTLFSGAAFMFFALLGVVCSAALGAMGFTGRASTVGIDLGTTFSVVAVRQGGNITVIPSEGGGPLTPSVVSFLRDGRVLVGAAATRYRQEQPRRTIFNAKRFIGRAFDDPIVKADAKVHPFDVVPNMYGNGTAFCLDVDYDASNDEDDACRHRVTPVDVGAAVLRSLVAATSRFLSHSQVSKAVVAVPAEFSDDQRAATERAYAAAGLKVLRIIDEPVAAAIAYGLDRRPDVHNVVVFDFGGGTLDISLLFISNGAVEVINNAGDEHLGGEDFDVRIAEYAAAEIHKTHGVRVGDDDQQDPTESSGNHNDDARRVGDAAALPPPCTSAVLRTLAERAKRRLSDAPSATMSCALGDGRRVDVKLSADDFGRICRDLFQRMLVPLKTVLANAGTAVEEVDEVVMVGGSSRMPRVRRVVSDYFGGKKLQTHIDPDLSVAIGAAHCIE